VVFSPEIIFARPRSSVAMRRLFGFAVSCALVISSARASDDWGHDFDGLIASPGTKVIFTKNGKDDMREIKLANGVSFFQTRHDGKISVVGNDSSGHGAVVCGITMLLTVRHALSICAPQQSTEKIAELDSQLDRIANFIVVNSVPPQPKVSKAALQAQIDEAKAKVASDTASDTTGEAATYCNSGLGARVVGHFDEFYGDGKLKKWTDDLLSVPRPPVLNPCI
jgi:hypothetical protein